MDTPLRILGIDPGTRHVGFGVVEVRGSRVVWLASGSIHAKGDAIAERLVTIYRGLRDAVRLHAPHCAAVETVFTGTNPKTAIAIGEGRGVAVLAAAEQGLVVTGYAPALIKRAVVGNGRADKEAVRAMVRVLLKMPQPTETDHESDALAIAITHAHHRAAGPQPVRRRGGGAGRGIPDRIARQLPPEVLAHA